LTIGPCCYRRLCPSTPFGSVLELEDKMKVRGKNLEFEEAGNLLTGIQETAAKAGAVIEVILKRDSASNA